MAKFTGKLCTEFKYMLNFVRVPIYTNAAVTRVKSAHFCRYSRISENIVK